MRRGCSVNIRLLSRRSRCGNVGAMSTATPFAASPTKRLYAAIIDLMIIGALALVLSPIDWDVGASASSDRFVALVYFVYQAAFLHFWRGQTPGRRLLDITVVQAAGGEIGLIQAVLRPGIRAVAVIATTDIAWRFVWPEYGTYNVPIFPLVEVGLLYTIQTRTTIADAVSRTVTINNPPPQPHRAPAAPMYSATDAELGFPPRRKK
jgi:uncharacterized RDD family membrane protein YckC